MWQQRLAKMEGELQARASTLRWQLIRRRQQQLAALLQLLCVC